jgi:hypothetical protein
MAERKKLGDFLIEAGLIDDMQLQAALAHQRNWGGRLGSILIEMRFIGEADLTRVIAEKLRIPAVNLFEPEIPDGIIKLIKPDTAKKYGAVPVGKDGGALVVALADPMDIAALDEIRFITGLVIKPALAAEAEIKDAIKKYYDREAVVHRERLSIQEKFKSSSSEKMEIIRGTEMKADPATGVEWKPPSEPVRPAEQEPVAVPDRLLLDALVSLLIEKELVSREELVKMVAQKKMGL